MTDAKELLSKAETRYDRVKSHLRDGANWFHDHEGEMFERGEAIEHLCNDLGVDESISSDIIRELVSDIVDPIVQIVIDGEKHVGVVEYEVFDGAYGYSDYDDVIGSRKRVVCAQCVHESEFDHSVRHATGGDGSHDVKADYDELVESIHHHYKHDHGEMPEDVETGASLLSGTTIGGNTAFHAGNDGSGSGLDADKLDGQQASAFTPNFTASGLTSISHSPNNWKQNNRGNPIMLYFINITSGDNGHEVHMNSNTSERIVTANSGNTTSTNNTATGSTIIVPEGHYWKYKNDVDSVYRQDLTA